MAPLQGGDLLAQAARGVTPMRIALDMAIDRIRDYAVRILPCPLSEAVAYLWGTFH
jgi:hypothetical protein